jgi:hypothetical protein
MDCKPAVTTEHIGHYLLRQALWFHFLAHLEAITEHLLGVTYLPHITLI